MNLVPKPTQATMIGFRDARTFSLAKRYRDPSVAALYGTGVDPRGKHYGHRSDDAGQRPARLTAATNPSDRPTRRQPSTKYFAARRHNATARRSRCIGRRWFDRATFQCADFHCAGHSRLAKRATAPPGRTPIEPGDAWLGQRRVGIASAQRPELSTEDRRRSGFE